MTLLFAPWRDGRLWRGLAAAALDVPLGLIYGIGVSVVFVLGLGFSVTFIVGIPLLWATLLTTSVLARLERSRVAALLDLNLPRPLPATPSGRRWTLPFRMLKVSSRRREVAYLAIVTPLLGVFAGLVLTLWGAALMLVALPAYVRALPGRSADFGSFRIGTASAYWACAIGAGLLLLAPHATRLLSGLHRWCAAVFLGPPRREDLERQVEALEHRREAAVDSAEAERRRIERDLHDGAQQRLVALAMDLGRARERLDRDPESARQLIVDAHEEAKAALADLRDLTRGIHPAVLTERGLDAALSAVVARCPVPVHVEVRVDPRPPAPIESAAYFVVAEALTNVAKHAHASYGNVTVARIGHHLRIDVEDNGQGGAQSAPGGGIEGLRGRISALGGELTLSSPVGGPTRLIVELPCGS